MDIDSGIFNRNAINRMNLDTIGKQRENRIWGLIAKYEFKLFEMEQWGDYYYKVVNRGNHTENFNIMLREVRELGGEKFEYLPVHNPEEKNGYKKLIDNVRVDWEKQILLIIKI